VWSRADEKRAETIRELRRKTEPDYRDAADETYWIPYCLSFLSRYPLYNLLGDYLRGMWIHWNKATNLFHAEEVSRILSFPAPRLNDLVRIDMKDYALCYQFPSSPTGFQNFAMWPLFSCLTLPNIVGLVEAAVSPTRRIILTSHHPAMLTIAAETIRFCVRVYEWSGLYVPVVHARNVNEMAQEPGPYILGITTECRSLFQPPKDALLVDLDRNLVITDHPPNILSHKQRQKMITRLTQALNHDVEITGVPQHLKSAYGGGKLIPAGQIIVLRGEVESVQDPLWWNQDSIMAVMDHVCEKLGRNTGIKAVFGGSMKKPLMTKISMRHMNEIVRERNQYSRDALEAWQDFINLKGRMDTELQKVAKRNNYLEQEVETWKLQFQKFQNFVEQLNKELAELRIKIESHKRENRRLTGLMDQQKEDAARLSLRLSGTERQRDNALEALVLQQGIAEDLERERARNRKEIAALSHTNSALQRQRNEAQRVVLHLRSLITGQTHHMEHIVRTIGSANELAEYVNEGFEDVEEDEEEDSAGLKPSEPVTRASTSTSNDGQYVTPAMESQLLASNRRSKRFSTLSMSDVADQHLREKTDAIADIIRNISEQCAAAVEGLQLANDAAEIDEEDPIEEDVSSMGGHSREDSGNLSPVETRHNHAHHGTGHLTPTSEHSSIPPTPDLVHQRSSTALSMASTAPTNYTARESLNQNTGRDRTKIMEDEDAERAYASASVSGDAGEPSKKQQVVDGPSSTEAEPVLSRAIEA
jgi:DENN (AEX-3) domain